jgi:FkbM family methyltransferase
MLNAVKALAKRAPFLRDLVRQREELRRDLAEARAKSERAEHAKVAYALWGEDQILDWVFQNRPDGFYVDVGAYHPALHSNTKLLYDRGWSGINIDCNPTMIGYYADARPRDISLNVAAGAAEGPVKVYLFHEWASSNTVSRAWADATSRVQSVSVQREIEVPGYPLRTLLERHLPPGRTVDLLNVDVETVDLEVLQSNDWKRFRPLVVAIEDIEFDLDAPAKSATYRYLREQGYHFFSRTIFTNFFADEARRDQLNGCP